MPGCRISSTLVVRFAVVALIGVGQAARGDDDGGAAALAAAQRAQAALSNGVAPERVSCSEEPTPSTSFGLCESPGALVCSEADRTRFRDITGRLADRLGQAALTEVAPRGGIAASYAALERLKRRNPRRWSETYRAYLAALERRAFAELGETPQSLLTYFTRLRGELIQAIDARPFSAAVKARMRAAINRVRLLLPSQYFTNDPDAIQKLCNERGLHINAFATNEDNTIVVCPITLLMGHQTGRGSSFPDPFASSFETMAHELGHFIDNLGFANELRPFESCLVDVHGFQSRRNRIDAAQLRELSADAWSASTTAVHIKSMSRAEATAFLREAYHGYCSGDSAWTADEHLPDHPRLLFVLGQHPALRARFGCRAPSAAEPSCDISGTVTERQKL